MSQSPAKRLFKMYQAKDALSLLNDYAKTIQEPSDMEKLLSMLTAKIQKVSGQKSNDTLKSVTAFSLLLTDLNRKAVKVKYTFRRNTAKADRDKMIMDMRKNGVSYQKIADRLALRGDPISAVAVFKIVKKIEAMEE